MRIVTIVAALFLIGSGVAAAQTTSTDPTPTDRRRVEAVTELQDSILLWLRAEVLPELRELKGKLDAGLSPEDLTTLNVLRTHAAGLRARGIALNRSMREAWLANDRALMATHRAEMDTLTRRRMALLGELKPIAERHRDLLTEMVLSASGAAMGWKREAKAIGATWMKRHADILPERSGVPFPADLVTTSMGGQLPPIVKLKLLAAWLMLWDGGDFTQGLEGSFPDRTGDLE